MRTATPLCACECTPCSCSSNQSTEYRAWQPISNRSLRDYDMYGEDKDDEGSSSAEDGASADSALAGGGGAALKAHHQRKRCCDDDFSALSTRLRCLLATGVVLLVLTAVFVPLYHFVFREHLGQLWQTLFRTASPSSGGGGATGGPGSTGTGFTGSGTDVFTLDETVDPSEASVWKPRCPDAPVLEWNRFDCYPEDPDVDEHMCQDRGCCWAITNVRTMNDKDGPAAREHYRDPVPKCILPLNSGYRIAGPEQSLFGGYELPLQRISSPSRYGDDIAHLKVRVHMQTPYRLRIKIYDPSEERYEVPDPVIPVEMDLGSPLIHEGEIQMYATSYGLGSDPFSFQVRRTKTGTVIFDTGVGALLFSNQFLQLSARLPSDRVYGLGEHVRDRFQHDVGWRTWSIFNRDTFPEDHSNLYGSHPMYMCIEKDNHAHAVLLLNSNAMEVQLQPTPAVTFRTTGGVFDFYFFLGPTPEDIVRQYTEAVGRPLMPPYWSLGFHLGRWGYRTTEYVRDTQKKMRDMNMPQDVVCVNRDVQLKHRLFTLDQNNFAKLPALVSELRGRGQRLMLVMEPGVAVPRGDPGPYEPLESGERLGVFVNDTWGMQPIQGLGWPGTIVFPDFGNPMTQTWWAEQLRQYHQIVPFDGLWITANEPSNYANGSTNGCLDDNLNQPPYKPKTKGRRLFERTLCMDAVHWLKDRKHRHYNVHNLYGKAMSQATVSAMNALSEPRRSLVMSRSTFVGSGRYVGHWLGDNASRWPDMARSIIAMMEFALYGIPLVGADVCGFYDDAQEELCLRWMQLGIFYPLVRNNNAIESSAQDPSAFSVEFQAVARNALKLRYELLPFLYTLFHHAHTKGTTVARPLFHVFPNDTESYEIDRQFMWGEALLMTPVVEQGVVSVEGYFPAAKWYDYHTGREFSNFDRGQWLPVYSPLFDPDRPCNLHVRGGFVIPMQGHANTTAVSRKNPMKLLVALNASGGAIGDLYWDDGETRDAQLVGEYIYLTFRAINNTLKICSYQYKKLFNSTFDELAIMFVRVLGIRKRPVRVELDGYYQLSRRQYRWHHSNKVMDLKQILMPLRKNTTVRWFMS